MSARTIEYKFDVDDTFYMVSGRGLQKGTVEKIETNTEKDIHESIMSTTYYIWNDGNHNSLEKDMYHTKEEALKAWSDEQLSKQL